ncbi:MAG: hypothetical protein ACI92C_002847 [Neolewinella sp.]|jgi:hypothetical protein
MPQPSLFPEPEKQKKLGHAELNYKNASSIITKASGFVDSYDFTVYRQQSRNSGFYQ